VLQFVIAELVYFNITEVSWLFHSSLVKPKRRVMIF